jgi:ABC-type antimicrobial peptide transport system permease subunit
VALRSMLATRGRVASTLLALVIGVFVLSLITMLAQAITNRFEQMLVEETGGNIIVFTAGQGNTVQSVEAQLASIDGVNSYAMVGTYNVQLIALEDISENQIVSYDELKARADGEAEGDMMAHGNRNLSRYVSTIDARGVDSNLPDVPFYRGRQLTPADAGKPYIVITANEKTLAAGFDVGDKLTFRFEGSSAPVEMTFEIVGMVDRTEGRFTSETTSPNYAPLDAFPTALTPDTVKAVVDVEPDRIDDMRRTMNRVPGAFVLETRLINDVINRVVGQFTSFPILVASLALLVGGIVIANSVALSTMERRREIGIMKAVGVQRERVLGMLLLENGLMGLIGGLIGVGLGSVILLLLIAMVFGGALASAVPYLTALTLMGMCVLIALLAAVVTAWGASGEKPLNVLRYE